MSTLPGLGLTAPNASNTQQQQQHSQQSLLPLESRTITLTAGSEWRFEVVPDTTISLKLLPPPATPNLNSSEASSTTGTAEIFGTELAPNHLYEFPGLTKAAVYTHHGCTFTVSGVCESDYTAEETPMTEYTNLHFALENLRATATQEMGGPRVLVVGPRDSGKTTLIKTLAAYATRSGRTPLIISLDPGEGMLCLPGSVSAAVMGTGAVLDVEDAAGGGWGSSAIGGPSAVPVKNPLVYHYGYAGPEERPDVFKPVATRLALAATSRFEEDEGVKAAGMLVDVAGSVCSGKAGLDVLSHIVSEFSINVLLTLGSERLYSDLLKRFPTPPTATPDEKIHILRLPKSGGCVDRDEAYMRLLRQQQIRTYFFGTKRNPLSPHTLGVEWLGLGVLRMGDSTQDLDALAFLPGNDDDDTTSRSTSPHLYTPTLPSLAMQSALLVLKNAPNPLNNISNTNTPSGILSEDDEAAIRDAPVVGYVYVADVEEAKKRVRVLSPVGGRLPQGAAVVWGGWDGGLAVGVGGLLGG